MLNRYRLTKKDLCPCGSGKLYIDCCQKRSDRIFHSDKEKLAIIGKISKKSRIRICLYKGCNATGKSIIQAHALQENKILSQIAVDNQVLAQNFNEDPVILEINKGIPEPFYFLKEQHIKNVSVATCFCHNHDDKIFAKIEKDKYPFNPTDTEQLFLFAYRTLSFEYYKVLVTKKMYSNLIKEIPQHFRDPFVIRAYKENLKKFDELLYYKNILDNALSERHFDILNTVALELPEQIKFASYMCIAPPFDLKGKKIKNIDCKSKTMKYILITIFPDKDKSYVLVSSLREDINIYGNYINQFKSLPIGVVKYYLNIFIPFYTENFILSPILWDKLDKKGQMALQYAVAETKNFAIIKGIQFGMKNISKLNILEQGNISTAGIAFDFFQ